MSVLGGLLELTDWIEPSFGAWRYIFSSEFRAKKRDEWRSESILYVIWEIFWSTIALLISLGVVAVFGWVAWRLAST